MTILRQVDIDLIGCEAVIAAHQRPGDIATRRKQVAEVCA